MDFVSILLWIFVIIIFFVYIKKRKKGVKNNN